MRTIVMDTSNQYLIVALYNDDHLLEYKQVKALRQQSELAVPYLEEILTLHQLTLKDIDQMVITVGPGSYTGVRIAMTIAKTLAVILPIKIKGISSLAVLAGKQKAISMIDARSQKVYVGMYENGQALMEDTIMSLDDFKEFYKLHTDFKLVGDTHLVEQECEEIKIYENLFELSKLVEPIENVDALVPTYIKDVEVKKQC